MNPFPFAGTTRRVALVAGLVATFAGVALAQ